MNLTVTVELGVHFMPVSSVSQFLIRGISPAVFLATSFAQIVVGVLIPSFLFMAAGVSARWLRQILDDAHVSLMDGWLQITAITDIATWMIAWTCCLIMMGLIVFSAQMLINGLRGVMMMPFVAAAAAGSSSATGRATGPSPELAHMKHLSRD